MSGAVHLATIGLHQGVNYNNLLSTVLQALVFLANLAGGIVVGIGVTRGLATYLGELLKRGGGEVPKEAIRLSLGRSLALALEFQLGADILGTALNPNLSDIATLAAIVVLRTVLNYFLSREIQEAVRRHEPAVSAHSQR